MYAALCVASRIDYRLVLFLDARISILGTLRVLELDDALTDACCRDDTASAAACPRHVLEPACCGRRRTLHFTDARALGVGCLLQGWKDGSG